MEEEVLWQRQASRWETVKVGIRKGYISLFCLLLSFLSLSFSLPILQMTLCFLHTHKWSVAPAILGTITLILITIGLSILSPDNPHTKKTSSLSSLTFLELMIVFSSV
jgi:Sec-independent protein secretion pathway component TatC